MKLTILALALSTYCAAEEDYYYDGVVNTYYDDYADADAAARAPISGVDDVPAQAGANLCAGIGTAGFEYASDLIGGEW